MAHARRDDLFGYRGDDPGESPALTAMRKGIAFLATVRGDDGAWRSDYGGPMFLLPMYVAACFITGREISDTQRTTMVGYLRSAQNADGSVGLHVEDQGSMFASCLCYVALRLLGVEREEPIAARLRRWIQANGTALGAASWGKLVLALLNLYPYAGLNPIIPELWLLPWVVPFHPGRLWCHCRQVYLPMAYLYGIKARVAESEIIFALRRELYDRPYDRIDFAAHRGTIAPSDDRVPATPLLRLGYRLLGAYEAHHRPELRQRALAEVYDHIRYEDEVTSFIDIGPINSILNALVHHFRDPNSETSRCAFATLSDYLCEAPDGIKYNGYNSTALWDTAFCAQAILATPVAREFADVLRRAHRYIEKNQVLEDPPDKERVLRHAARGGGPFSDRTHGWPITDCTAEGINSAIGLAPLVADPIPLERLRQAVELILSYQNSDGGWATYEQQRGPRWLELLNPSQVFRDIMVDYSYVECSSACMQALRLVRERLGGERDRRLERALRRGERFLRRAQRSDGCFEGSWAVCFTYGTWFGVWGLIAGGVRPGDRAIRNACGFLFAHQNPDGGWGEHHTSCTERRYVRAESRAANTAWALLALARAGLGDSAAAQRGADWLVSRQLSNGDWLAEPLVGVFNKTTLVNYEHCRRYFPIWALAELARACPTGSASRVFR